MTKDDLQRKHFMSQIKTQIMEVALNLWDDPNYSKSDAIEDLLKLAAAIDEGGETEITVPERVSKVPIALKVMISQS